MSKHEFRLVSNEPGPMTCGDLYNLPHFFLMHGIYSNAKIKSITLQPFYDRTEMVVDLESFGGTET